MKNVKTFEEFWPFRAEDPKEKNKKILIGVCDYLFTYFTTHTAFGSKVKKVDIYQSSKVKKIQIYMTLMNGDCYTFSYKIDDNFMIQNFESYYATKNDVMMLHSTRKEFDKVNSMQYRVLDSIVEKINYYFKLYKVMI
jgi:hypothetical protein